MMVKLLLLSCALMFGGSVAFACLSDRHDRDQALAAIDQALSTRALGEAEKAAIRELRDKAAISPKSLTAAGLRLQAQYRSQAMERLGLPRIPSRPALEFAALDKALADSRTPDEK